MSGAPKTGIDLQFEQIINYYNGRNADLLTEVIGGDGPVSDASLIPERDSPFANVEEWLAAAESVNDVVTTQGYGFGEPFEMFMVRTNDVLRASGMDSVFVTMKFWANQDCELRVESGQIISSPDPCRFGELFGDPHEGCAGTFGPRAGHFAAWTGEEVLILGGQSGTTDAELLTSALAYNPETNAWRNLAPLPIPVGQWPARRSAWTGSELILVGRTAHTSESAEEIVTLGYTPATDEWMVLAPMPADRMASGGLAWTGEEIVVAGGDLLYPAADAWAYSPETDKWRRLPDPGFPPTEGTNAVWTGSEVIVFGGYAGQGGAPPSHAYDPTVDAWREIATPGNHWIEDHEMIWTGEAVVVSSGHLGPQHSDVLLIYDPTADEWRRSAPMPILPAERQTSVWTGSELIIWGGLATYGTEPDDDGDFVQGEGAAYDPSTDTWRVMAHSPLADRCDHSATWTGQQMVVFGGMTTCGHPGVVADGHAASYSPTIDEWIELTR